AARGRRNGYGPRPVLACGVSRFPSPWPHELRRPGRASGLFPRRVRYAPPLARRSSLWRHHRPLPIPARAREQPSRHHARHLARRAEGRACRLGRLLRAVGLGAHPLRLWRRLAWAGRAAALAAWAQDSRRRGGGTGGLGHGAQPLPRPLAREHGRGSRVAGSRHARRRRPGRRDRAWRADRLALARPSARGASRRHDRNRARAQARHRRARAVRDFAVLAAGAGCRVQQSCARTHRQLLSRGRARLRRRPCRAATLAASRGAAGLGKQRCVSRGLWRGPGRARAALHLLRLSRRDHAAGAERLEGRDPLPVRDLSAVLPAAHRRAALLGRAAAPRRGLRGVNAAVVGLLLAALYTPVWTSAITSAADFGLGIAAFLLLAFWRVPPWL